MTPQTPPLSLDTLVRHHHGGEDEAASPVAKAALDLDATARDTLHEWQAQDAVIGTLFPDPGDAVPPAMRRLLDDAANATTRPAVRWRSVRWRSAFAGAALFMAGTAAGWLLHPAPQPAGFDLARAAIAAHMTYASEVAHPVEVAGSERDHLVEWLSKRLGQPIHAPDLSPQGFRLLGGRLLPGDTRPAAQFMYEDDAGQRLTIYVIPETGADTAFRRVEAQGQQGLWWTGDGLGCVVIAPLARQALHDIAMVAYDQLI